MKSEMLTEKDFEKYEVTKVAEGAYHDSGYKVMTIVFTVSPEALNDYNWRCKSGKEDPDWYDTNEEFREAVKSKDDNKEIWEQKVKEMLGWKENSGCITQDLSEIFTAVFMEKD